MDGDHPNQLELLFCIYDKNLQTVQKTTIIKVSDYFTKYLSTIKVEKAEGASTSKKGRKLEHKNTILKSKDEKNIEDLQ